MGWCNHLAGGKASARSGGSEPGNEINPSAVAAMAEIGIDIRQEFRDDPAGQDLAAVRPIRDEIATRVRALLASLDMPRDL